MLVDGSVGYDVARAGPGPGHCQVLGSMPNTWLRLTGQPRALVAECLVWFSVAHIRVGLGLLEIHVPMAEGMHVAPHVGPRSCRL